ncbi:hypothetical protein BT69DRAFT_593256 [Atractiella rhizophila]|nr:hypothetical protein BT69DRAFT_593256 [Atractiella rhizophila]
METMECEACLPCLPCILMHQQTCGTSPQVRYYKGAPAKFSSFSPITLLSILIVLTLS